MNLPTVNCLNEEMNEGDLPSDIAEIVESHNSMVEKFCRENDLDATEAALELEIQQQGEFIKSVDNLLKNLRPPRKDPPKQGRIIRPQKAAKENSVSSTNRKLHSDPASDEAISFIENYPSDLQYQKLEMETRQFLNDLNDRKVVLKRPASASASSPFSSISSPISASSSRGPDHRNSISRLQPSPIAPARTSSAGAVSSLRRTTNFPTYQTGPTFDALMRLQGVQRHLAMMENAPGLDLTRKPTAPRAEPPRPAAVKQTPVPMPKQSSSSAPKPSPSRSRAERAASRSLRGNSSGSSLTSISSTATSSPVVESVSSSAVLEVASGSVETIESNQQNPSSTNVFDMDDLLNDDFFSTPGPTIGNGMDGMDFL